MAKKWVNIHAGWLVNKKKLHAKGGVHV